jgi:hypothetical protein
MDTQPPATPPSNKARHAIITQVIAAARATRG